MTSPLLTASDHTRVDFELADAINPTGQHSGVLNIDVDPANIGVLLNVQTNNGREAAGLYLTRQGALDLAHYLINLVHPHAG